MNSTDPILTSTVLSPPIAPPSSFEQLGLIPPLVRALQAEGYELPTPIQSQAIPHLLRGRDFLGCAQTGTGKTAAFALPILQHLSKRGRLPGERPAVRALILSPTRELAAQIGQSFSVYGRFTGLRGAVVFGGVGQNRQVETLRSGVDILVATPGRLCDLISQGLAPLGQVEILVLDEADRMLDMGFLPDVRRILSAVPRKRQTLFFSATMPAPIEELSRAMLQDPIRVNVAPVATTAEKIDQTVYFVEHQDKRALMRHLLDDPGISRAIVFTRTKHGANRVCEQLSRTNVPAAAIHGNKSQSARERALADFKAGAIRILVATDIAARGIDVDGISHVINYDIPNEPETYVHRIGRTARAGAHGFALSLCSAEERAYLTQIERLIRQRVRVVAEHPFRSTSGPRAPAPAARQAALRPPQGGRRPEARRQWS